jgi:hypothetical protein
LVLAQSLAAGARPAAAPRADPPPTAVKPGPAGIVCLLDVDRPDHPLRHLEQQPCWKNPNVAGVRLRSRWDKIEKVEGKFDWALLDQAVVLARQHHKRLGLSVAAGIATPEWVYQAGAARFALTVRSNVKQQRAVMPLPWDKVALRKWKVFVQAMGSRYDGSPQVAYVVLGGVGYSIETVLVRTDEDRARFDAAGGVARWVKCTEQVIDTYAAAFPHTAVLLSAAPVLRGRDGEPPFREVVRHGISSYRGRFGVMNCGLTATSGSRFYINRTIRSLADQTPVGFQMVWSTKGKGAQLLKGTLAEALDRGVQLKAHFVEVYQEDCRNPAYADELRKAGARLNGRK